MTRKAGGMSVNVGSASLVTVFTVLCLSVFAVLSVTTAFSGRRLSRRAAEAVTEYYEADSACETYIAALRAELSEGRSPKEAMCSALPENAGLTPDGADAALIRFFVPVDDTQELFVTARIEAGTLRVTEWRVIRTAEWEPADSLAVWDGGGSAPLPPD